MVELHVLFEGYVREGDELRVGSTVGFIRDGDTAVIVDPGLVPDPASILDPLRALGGEIIHPGQRWSICRDTEGSPFGLTTNPV